MNTKIVVPRSFNLVAALLFACLSVAQLSAETLLTESFNIGTSTQGTHSGYWWLGHASETPLPTSAQVKYWKADANNSDGTSRGMGFNGPDTTYANAFINQRGNTNLSSQKWWLRDLHDGPDGSRTYSANGTTAIHMTDGEVFKNPSFTSTLYYTYGSNSTATMDLAVTYSLALLNDAGNGYVATISVMDGVVNFYRLDNGLAGDWGTALATSSATSRLNNFVTASFGITDGSLNLNTTVSSTAGPSLTVQDSTYSEFTTIGFAALLENKDSPYVRIRNVTLSGDLQSIPEPSTYAALAALIALVATMAFRRYSSGK